MGKLIVEPRRVRKEIFSFLFSFSILLLSLILVMGCAEDGSSGDSSSSTTTDTETGDTGTGDSGTADGSSCSASSSPCDINGVDPLSIRICPSSPTILKGVPYKLTLIGIYKNNCRLDLTSFAWWESDNSSFININGGPNFFATVGNGSFNVTATYGTRNTTTQVRLSTAPGFSSIRPYSFSIVNTSAVGYTLSANLASGTVTYTRTGGTADGNVHTVSLLCTDFLEMAL